MAVAREVLIDGREDISPKGIEEPGKLIIFRTGPQRADMAAYDAYNEGKWSLPPSYRYSPRRGLFIAGSSNFDPDRVEVPRKTNLRILGERVIDWQHLSDPEMHSLTVEVFVPGIHPDLGTPNRKPWTPEETILSRQVYIKYDPRTLEPRVIVRDRTPKSKRIDQMQVQFCDSSGVTKNEQTNEYFGAGLSEFRPH